MLNRGILIVTVFLAAFFSYGAELPHIGFVYPAGGKQGTVFEVIVGGKYLKEAFSANITGENTYVEVLGDPDKDLETYKKEDLNAGISVLNANRVNPPKAELGPGKIKFDRELTRKEINKIDREKRRKKKNQKNDQFPDTVKLRIALLDNCEPGDHELRLISPSGLSNKLTFQVGKLNEYEETEPNNRKEQAAEIPSLPLLINGRLLQNDVDGFRFKAKKGQSLVIKAAVRKLMPYLADAVPGWFQGSLALYDNKGNEIIHTDSFRFDQDPVLFYEVPEDNEYYLEIRDSIYRGREDFVYRLSLGELPFITHIFPAGGSYEKPIEVELFGKNLPVKKIQVTGKTGTLPLQYISVNNKELLSNTVPFELSDLPEIYKKYIFHPQPVPFPVIINGALATPGSKDFYAFEGKTGQEVYIEVSARKLGSPLDSIIAIFSSSGEKLAENDDDATFKWYGLSTHHSDSALKLRLPKDDTYLVSLVDVSGKGGEEYVYRLRISSPLPDFALYSTPPNVTVPRGGSGFFRIHALRKEGFNGPIRLSLKNASEGLRLDSAVIPEGKSDIKVTVSSSYDIQEGLKVCKLEGSADLQGRVVYREVFSAEEYTQAFAYKHLVPVNEQLLLIKPPMPFSLSFSLPAGKIFTLLEGKDNRISVEVVRNGGFNDFIQLQLLDAPEGISLRGGLGKDKNKTMVSLLANSKVPPGLFENLILSGVATIPVEDKERPENKNKKARLYVTAPALSVVVLKEKKEKKGENIVPGK